MASDASFSGDDSITADEQASLSVATPTSTVPTTAPPAAEPTSEPSEESTSPSEPIEEHAEDDENFDSEHSGSTYSDDEDNEEGDDPRPVIARPESRLDDYADDTNYGVGRYPFSDFMEHAREGLSTSTSSLVEDDTEQQAGAPQYPSPTVDRIRETLYKLGWGSFEEHSDEEVLSFFEKDGKALKRLRNLELQRPDLKANMRWKSLCGEQADLTDAGLLKEGEKHDRRKTTYVEVGSPTQLAARRWGENLQRSKLRKELGHEEAGGNESPVSAVSPGRHSLSQLSPISPLDLSLLRPDDGITADTPIRPRPVDFGLPVVGVPSTTADEGAEQSFNSTESQPSGPEIIPHEKETAAKRETASNNARQPKADEQVFYFKKIPKDLRARLARKERRRVIQKRMKRHLREALFKTRTPVFKHEYFAPPEPLVSPTDGEEKDFDLDKRGIRKGTRKESRYGSSRYASTDYEYNVPPNHQIARKSIDQASNVSRFTLVHGRWMNEMHPRQFPGTPANPQHVGRKWPKASDQESIQNARKKMILGHFTYDPMLDQHSTLINHERTKKVVLAWATGEDLWAALLDVSMKRHGAVEDHVRARSEMEKADRDYKSKIDRLADQIEENREMTFQFCMHILESCVESFASTLWRFRAQFIENAEEPKEDFPAGLIVELLEADDLTFKLLYEELFAGLCSRTIALSQIVKSALHASNKLSHRLDQNKIDFERLQTENKLLQDQLVVLRENLALLNTEIESAGASSTRRVKDLEEKRKRSLEQIERLEKTKAVQDQKTTSLRRESIQISNELDRSASHMEEMEGDIKAIQEHNRALKDELMQVQDTERQLRAAEERAADMSKQAADAQRIKDLEIMVDELKRTKIELERRNCDMLLQFQQRLSNLSLLARIPSAGAVDSETVPSTLAEPYSPAADASSQEEPSTPNDRSALGGLTTQSGRSKLYGAFSPKDPPNPDGSHRSRGLVKLDDSPTKSEAIKCPICGIERDPKSPIFPARPTASGVVEIDRRCFTCVAKKANRFLERIMVESEQEKSALKKQKKEARRRDRSERRERGEEVESNSSDDEDVKDGNFVGVSEMWKVNLGQLNREGYAGLDGIALMDEQVQIAVAEELQTRAIQEEQLRRKSGQLRKDSKSEEAMARLVKRLANLDARLSSLLSPARFAELTKRLEDVRSGARLDTAEEMSASWCRLQ